MPGIGEESMNNAIIYIVIGCVLAGAIIGGIIGHNMNNKAKLEHEKAEKNKIQEYKNNINKLVNNVNKLENEKISLTEMQTQISDVYDAELLLYNKVKEVSISAANTIYDALLEQFSDTLDPRDWKNIDLIIFYYETGRADTLKEALIQVDRQRQTDSIVKAISDASREISSTIRTSIAQLKNDLQTNFNNLTNILNKALNKQLDVLKDNNAAIDKLSFELQKTINYLGNEQSLTNTLLTKINTNSDYLIRDVNYMLGYQAPSNIEQ